jgi:hypothetical protein
MPREDRNETTIIAIDPDPRRRIESSARDAGISPAEPVRRAFEAYRADAGVEGPSEPSAYAVFRDAGLIGCLEAGPDAPTDLATNPSHMEGLGRPIGVGHYRSGGGGVAEKAREILRDDAKAGRWLPPS